MLLQGFEPYTLWGGAGGLSGIFKEVCGQEEISGIFKEVCYQALLDSASKWWQAALLC